MPVDTTSWSPEEIQIYEQIKNSEVNYSYHSIQELRFELLLRVKIVAAAQALSQSGLRFATFANAECNEQYWNLTENGGFRIRSDTTPAAGIRDIFANGRKYATECATATLIVIYKGVLDSINEASFNRLYSDLLLYDWHPDDHLPLIGKTGIHNSYPGDLLYFKNPDFNPETPEWRGENVIKIDENLYYGHPFGMATAESIISSLNRNRRPGSFRSAYLTDDIITPNYAYLSQFAPEMRSNIIARIGVQHFIVPLPRP
ncbi:Protein-glutamine gamma-glutamyltransferase [compost metagenome]